MGGGYLHLVIGSCISGITYTKIMEYCVRKSEILRGPLWWPMFLSTGGLLSAYILILGTLLSGKVGREPPQSPNSEVAWSPIMPSRDTRHVQKPRDLGWPVSDPKVCSKRPWNWAAYSSSHVCSGASHPVVHFSWLIQLLHALVETLEHTLPVRK